MCFVYTSLRFDVALKILPVWLRSNLQGLLERRLERQVQGAASVCPAKFCLGCQKWPVEASNTPQAEDGVQPMYGGATTLRIWQSRNTRHLARDEQWTGYSIDKDVSAPHGWEALVWGLGRWEAWVAETLWCERKTSRLLIERTNNCLFKACSWGSGS